MRSSRSQARKRRSATKQEQQQLVTHFLRLRQEPDQRVLAFFASSALIQLTVLRKEVNPKSIWITVRSFEV